MRLKEKLYKQQQDLLNQRDVISNQQKKMAQMMEAEAPLFKDVCPNCGGEGCTCARWNWYGEADGINNNL